MITVNDLKQFVEDVDELLKWLVDLEKDLRRKSGIVYIRLLDHIRIVKEQLKIDKKYVRHFVLQHYDVRL